MSSRKQSLFGVALAALLFSFEPLSAQLLPVGAPTLLPGDTTVSAAAANQTVPALSAGGGMVLAVWQDSRTSPVFTGVQSGQDIWAVRLDVNGAPLDPVSFAVNMDGGDQKSPRVAWNGTQWLVAWVGQISTTGYYTDGLFAARVAADGTVLDTTPILLRADLGSGTFGDVASDGNGFAVFSTGWVSDTSHVYGQRIAANGTLLDVTPKIVATPGSSPSTPNGVTAAWAGNRYLVAWSQWTSNADNIRGRLTDASLAPQGGAFDISNTWEYEIRPDLASNGSQFFAVWDRYNTCCVGGASRAYGTRITTAGAVLDGGNGIAIYDTGGYGFQGCLPSVGWDGTQWVASWTEPATGGLRVSATRISAAGVVLNLNGAPVDDMPPRQEASAVAALSGGGSLVVWQDGRVIAGQAYDVYGSRLATNGLSTPLGSLSNSAPSQVGADVASGPGGGALLAWTSMASGQSRILVQRMDSAGQALGQPLELASGPSFANANAAWNGAGWLVTWDGTGSVRGKRLDANGVPIDAQPLLIMPGSGSDVAAQGDTFLVTALIPEAYPEFVDVFSRRVSAATGALLDPAPVFVGSSYATDQTVVAYEGGFLVAWEVHPTHNNPWSNIGLRLVSVNNVPGAQTSLSSASTYNARPAVAVGDGTALVVWQRNPSSQVNEDVVARLVGPGLALQGALITVSATAYSQQLPTAAWDGSQYIVAWQDSRSTPNYLFDRRTDLYAARVSAAGVVLDPAGIPVATDAAPDAWPALGPLGSGAVLLAWSDFQKGAPYASYRVAASVLGTVSPWTDLGNGLAGSLGVPSLIGEGSLQPLTPLTVALANAPAFASTTLVVGYSAINAPFKGGVLVPNTDLLLSGLVTDGAGGWLLADNWPTGVPADFPFWMQVWIADASGPAGYIASNALGVITP